jgi:thiamine biosynthesis lipoprotein
VTAVATASTDWDLWSTRARLVVTRPELLTAARAVVDVVLREVELAASRFRPDAEIVNLRPGRDGTVRLSPVLARLLERAVTAAELTGGSVDPTVGDSLRALGYDRDIRLVMRDGAPVRAIVREVHGWRRLDLRGRVLRLPRGLQLDLGATAKAVAADDSARAVAEHLDTGVLVNLGGDIATAGPAPDGGWQVLVRDLAGDPATVITLAPGTALATSSTQRRRWRRGDEEVHHIVDPDTGRPVDSPWRTVSVVGQSCFEANTASTATIVRGEDGLSWLDTAGLPARLVHRSGSVVTVAGWPGEEAAA